MKTIFFSLIIILSASLLSAQSWQWASRFGGISTDPQSNIPDESIKDMVVDDQGNVYFCGVVRTVANANGTPLPTFGAYDIIVGKIDCHGNLVWVQTAGGLFNDVAYSLILHDNYLYFTGEISATSNNPCNFFGNIITESTSDLFLAKMDTSGSLIWNKIGSPGMINLNSAAFSLSAHGNNLNLLFRVVSSNGGEIFPGEFVTRAWWQATLDTSGNIVSKFEITPNIEAFAKFEHEQGPNGDHYFLGNFQSLDSVSIGGQTVYHINPGITYSDILLFKFDSGGNLLWLEQIGVTSNNIKSHKLFIDQNDFVFITGSIVNGVIFGNDTMQNSFSSIQAFPFVAKYDAQGQSIWAAQASSQYNSVATGGVAPLPNGNLIWSGYFQGNAVFGSTTLSSSTSGLRDLFLCEVDSLGNIVGVEVMPCPGYNETPEVMISDSAGNIYLGGGYFGSMTINGTTHTSAGGGTDAFVAKYGYICTVGLNEELPLSEISLNVYPNPVSSTLNINITSSDIEKISILNLLGESILEFTPENNHTGLITIAVQHLPNGIYLVQAAGKTGRASAKFVKME